MHLDGSGSGVRPHGSDPGASPAEIWLKLENLQPIGSFKLRGAANAVLSAPREALTDGLVTTSTGNMAQGVAWMARELGVPATIVVPDNASAAKLAAVERLGGRIVSVPWEQWWAAVEADEERDLGSDVQGFFVHPVQDPPVMAGNGTIGLELVEQLDDIDAVLIPWGGGGLSTGIASALHALAPATKIFVCEPASGAPVTAALANDGVAVPVDFTPSFVDGAGSGGLLPKMWEHAKPLVSGSFAISARGHGENGAPAARARAHRGRRRRCASGRRCVGRPSRQRPPRLHRLGGEHRRRTARRDPRRPRSGLVDERALERCDRLTLQARVTHVMRIPGEHRVEHDRQCARAKALLVGDRSVLGEEPCTWGRSEQRPDEDEVDARIRDADVTPVDDSCEPTLGEEHVAQVKIAVSEHQLTRRRL